MKLSFKEKLLLSTFPQIDFFEANKRVLPTPLWILPGFFPKVSEGAVYNSLFKVMSDGDVFRSTLGKTAYISLTRHGFGKLQSKIKFYRFLREKWDGNIRMVLFDIPESDRKLRDALRFSLTDLGFVMWQRSVFLTPHVVEAEVFDIVKILEVKERVNILTVSKLMGQDLGELVRGLWNLKGMNERYNIFISQSREALNEKISNYKKWVERCQDLRFKYYDVLTSEPFLPRIFWGEEYGLEEATEHFLALGEKLLMVLERV